MKTDELKKRLAFATGQFEITKLRAMMAFAEATTGVATLRKTQQGREPTEEEKAKGLVIGWRDHSDQEKIKNTLQVMERHIQFMTELNESINILLSEVIDNDA